MKLTHPSLRAAAALLFAVALGAAAPADFHLALRESIPAADATVAAAPKSIELQFSQEPQVRGTSVKLMAGEREVALGEAKADAADGKVVRAAVTGAVAPGAYRVVWRTMAKDGHEVRGEYAFTFEPAT